MYKAQAEKHRAVPVTDENTQSPVRAISLVIFHFYGVFMPLREYFVIGLLILFLPVILFVSAGYFYIVAGFTVKAIRRGATWLDERFFQSIIVALILPILAGCAGFGQIEDISEQSTTQLRSMKQIQVYDNGLEASYTSLGTIKGISCKGSAISGYSSEEAAMTQLKIKATKLGANAILYPTCVNDASVDWGNNCWESWVCAGEAIRR